MISFTTFLGTRTQFRLLSYNAYFAIAQRIHKTTYSVEKNLLIFHLNFPVCNFTLLQYYSRFEKNLFEFELKSDSNR